MGAITQMLVIVLCGHVVGMGAYDHIAAAKVSTQILYPLHQSATYAQMPCLRAHKQMVQV